MHCPGTQLVFQPADTDRSVGRRMCQGPPSSCTPPWVIDVLPLAEYPAVGRGSKGSCPLGGPHAFLPLAAQACPSLLSSLPALPGLLG